VMSDLGIPLGAEGVDVVALAKERKGAIGRGKEALEQLRARKAQVSEGEPPPESTAEDAAPGRAWEDLVIAQADEAPPDADATIVKPERVFVPGAKEAIHLRAGSSERYLMERVRDEAHRFAITHHRKRRGKRALRSALDEIEGVGPTLKRALVKHFGTIAAIRSADVEALCEVKGIGTALAERIRDTLR